MNTNAKRHLDAAREFIAIAESGDAKTEAYGRAADEIIAAQKADPTVSYAAIGKTLFGKSETWALRLVQWRTSPARAQSPFGGEEENARKRISTPTNPIDRAAMAHRLMSDPEVVAAVMPGLLAEPTDASAHLQAAVNRKQAADREQVAASRRRTAEAGAMRLPARLARIVVKINEFAIGMAAARDTGDELAGLPAGEGKRAVVGAVTGLRDECDEWLAALADRGGTVIDVAGRETTRRGRLTA